MSQTETDFRQNVIYFIRALILFYFIYTYVFMKSLQPHRIHTLKKGRFSITYTPCFSFFFFSHNKRKIIFEYSRIDDEQIKKKKKP